jgi:hypothetical protein
MLLEHLEEHIANLRNMLRMPKKPVGNTLGKNWENQNPKSRTLHLLPPLSCPPLTSPTLAPK